MGSGIPTTLYDVAIVGGGHNALVAAAYLAKAGKRVVVVERLDHVGGAAVSERPWAGVDARLSRYSYLVSLLPQGIVRDLGLDIRLTRRRYSSYTPDPADPARGVLIDTKDAAATTASILRATGDPREGSRVAALAERVGALAERVFPTMTEPLRRRSELRTLIGDDALWDDLVERPLGGMLRQSLATDLLRGVAATDGLIGTFAASDDESLRQNRCFLFHVVGGGTGDWDVPVGGMGRITAELERAARDAGAELLTHADVTAIDPEGEVFFDGGIVRARLVLSGVGPRVLERLLEAGGAPTPASASVQPEGAQLKVNMLLRRLPRLRDATVAPEAAFAGTFHINETMTQLDAAHATASAGAIPLPLPAEIYCHSLTDPSILGPDLRASGAHTLTLFGLQVPHRLIAQSDRDAARARLLEAAFASLDSVLAEPIADCLSEAPDGTPCVEARTTQDLDEALGMTGGDIFHGPLAWPWADDEEPLDSPGARWGVATEHDRVLLCGSASRRGGGVSGLGGFSAAMAAIEILG